MQNGEIGSRRLNYRLKENEELTVEANGNTMEKLKRFKHQDNYTQALRLLGHIPTELSERFIAQMAQIGEVNVFDER